MKGYKNYYKKKNKKLRYFLLVVVIAFIGYLIIKSIHTLPFINLQKEKYIYIEKQLQAYDSQNDKLKKKVILSKINKTLNKLIQNQDLTEDGTLSYLAGSINFRKGIVELNKDLRNMYLDKAIYYFRKALALLNEKKKQGRLHYELGKSYFHKGEYYYYESLMELQEAKKLGYENKNTDKIITIIKLKKGDISDINYLINHFKSSKQGDVESFFYDALTYKKNKDYNKAKENFLKVEKHFSEKKVENEEEKYIIFKSLYCLGWLFYNEKSYKQAEKYYKKSIQHDENNADIYYWLGKVYEKTRNKRMAKKMYKKTLQINPDYKYAKLKLKKLKRGR